MLIVSPTRQLRPAFDQIATNTIELRHLPEMMVLYPGRVYAYVCLIGVTVFYFRKLLFTFRRTA